MKSKIAIQGVKGSNHHIVASNFYGENVDLLECLSFDELVDSLLDRSSSQAVMAIENSIAGSIIPNYALIDKYKLHIVGEYYLNVHHNLMALPGQNIEDLKEVCSHPMALLQCKDFFRDYPSIKLVEDVDTAEVARRISEKKLVGIGAISTNLSASLFNLHIIAPEIQTIKNNATRFVFIQTTNSAILESDINKASLKFQLDHKRGSLATVLNVMSDCKLNLTKIQSLPIVEKPWKYAFFVDVTFNNFDDYAKAKSILGIMAEDFKVLGEYKNANI